MAEKNFIDDEISEYKNNGFKGFIPVKTLRGTLSVMPQTGGVYVVLRTSESAPEFLERGTGGFFKGKDPNVTIPELNQNYVSDSKTVYIGKANCLRKRVKQLLSFGEGSAVGHWGGRYLWQLADSEDLLVAWKETGLQIPEAVESEMIRQFVATHGKRPFANLKG